MGRQVRVRRHHPPLAHRPVHLEHQARPGGGELVQPLFARDHQGALHGQPAQRLGEAGGCVGVGDPDQLAAHARRIGERTQEVEDRAALQRAPDRHQPDDRRVVRAREQEGDAQPRQAVLRPLAGLGEVQAQRLQRVGRAGARGGGSAAVLGDRHAAGRHHQRHGGGHVESVLPIAARAAHVDGARRGLDGDQPGSHRARRAGDLRCRLAAIGQRGEQVRDLRVRQLAIQHPAEQRLGLRLGHCPGHLVVSSQLASRSWP